MRIAVVGAGITGLATARTLVDAGHEVVLVERAGIPASAASAQNGGQLSYAFVAPLASPATLWQIPRLMLDPGSPLRVRPGLSAAAWRWCIDFLLACSARQARDTTSVLLSLGALSRERFGAWRTGLDGNPIEFERNGKLVIYRDAGSWRAAQRQVALQAGRGPEQQLCSPLDCLRAEPSLLNDEAPLHGGVLTPSEEVADCERVCRVLADSLAGQPGFEAHWHTDVLGWDHDGERVGALRLRGPAGEQRLPADAFVVASGVAAPRLLAPLGVRLPIAPLKGYSIELPAARLRAMPRLSVTDSAVKVVFAPLGAGERLRLRVAGMAELVGPNLQIDERRIAQLAEATRSLFGFSTPQWRPQLADLRPWAGLRPATPTGLPCIGRAGRWRNLYVNAGQGALGFTLAFGSAAVLAAELLGGPSPLRRLPRMGVHFRPAGGT